MEVHGIKENIVKAAERIEANTSAITDAANEAAAATAAIAQTQTDLTAEAARAAAAESGLADADISAIDYAADTHILTLTKQGGGTLTKVLPVASAGADGLMSAADVSAIATLTDKVNSIEAGGVWRGTFGTNAALQAAYPGYDVSATTWTAKDFVYVKADETQDGAQTVYEVVVDGAAKTLTYSHVTSVAIEQATNSALGVVKGSTADGKAYVENDGTLSLNGYDALVEADEDNASAITALDNAKQAKLTATGNTNLLVAPTAAGGQPTAKAITDFATAAQGAKADGAVQKSGDTMTGNLVMGLNKVTSTATYFNANELVTKLYADGAGAVLKCDGLLSQTIGGEAIIIGRVTELPNSSNPKITLIKPQNSAVTNGAYNMLFVDVNGAIGKITRQDSSNDYIQTIYVPSVENAPVEVLSPLRADGTTPTTSIPLTVNGTTYVNKTSDIMMSGKTIGEVPTTTPMIDAKSGAVFKWDNFSYGSIITVSVPPQPPVNKYMGYYDNIQNSTSSGGLDASGGVKKTLYTLFQELTGASSGKATVVFGSGLINGLTTGWAAEEAFPSTGAPNYVSVDIIVTQYSFCEYIWRQHRFSGGNDASLWQGQATYHTSAPSWIKIYPNA